jgi:hypothetical protein
MPEHKGWTNFATFAVNLAIDQDPAKLAFWNEVAEDCLLDPVPGQPPAYALGDMIAEQFCIEDVPEDLPMPYGAILEEALNEVNWNEIGAGLIVAAQDRITKREKDDHDNDRRQASRMREPQGSDEAHPQGRGAPGESEG